MYIADQFYQELIGYYNIEFVPILTKLSHK